MSAQVAALAVPAAGEAQGTFNARIVVIDNDPERSAEPVVARSARPDVSMEYIHQPIPGIAASRNRALDAAAADDLLVFVDDDELPEPDWLGQLLATRMACHPAPAAVWGLVKPKYPEPVNPWLVAGGFFVRAERPTGTRLNTAACSGLLLDMRQVRALGLRFDVGLAMGGGEDTLFTRTLAARGGVIVFCNEAVLWDVVQPERLTQRWVLTRAISHGNASVRVSLRLAPGITRRAMVRVQALGGGVMRILVGGARYGVGMVARRLRDQARGARTACRGVGIAAGGLGLAFQEYARDDHPRRWTRDRAASRKALARVIDSEGRA